MSPQESPRKTYQAHRDLQRGRILEVAERLFIQDGIDVVRMSEIAKAAHLTRVTLYEYFPNKQEIGWAVFQKVVEDLRDVIKDEVGALSGSGYEKIERFMLLLSVDLLGSHREHLRFIVEFNALYAREGNPARVREIVMQAGAGSHFTFAQLFEEGMADGSLRPDLDPALLATAMSNLLSGMNSRFALLGDNISEEFEQPVDRIYREICRAFLRGIQAKP